MRCYSNRYSFRFMLYGICLFIILGCRPPNKNNHDIDSLVVNKTNITNLDIKPFSNSIEFRFKYKGNVYFVKYLGKQENVVGPRVNINWTEDQIAASENNLTSITKNSERMPLLTDDDISVINDGIKKSWIYDGDINNKNDDVFILQISYRLHEDKESKRHKVTVTANDELKSYLINKLIYIHSLPIYEVKKGETLRSISEKFLGNSTMYEEIMKANNMNREILWVGEKIRIPQIGEAQEW